MVLKCRVGCKHFGETLMCPPYSPSVDEFRKIICEYSYALVFKFKSNAVASKEIVKYLSKDENDPSLTPDIKNKIIEFWKFWKQDKLSLLNSVIEIEKAAMKKGYSLALGFTTGSCIICEKCNIENKICIHPSEARYTAQSVGINIQQTLSNASMPMHFPMKDTPETFGIVLIA